MEVVGKIDKDRLDDCCHVVRKVAGRLGESLDIVRISQQNGGLFNYLLRVETGHRIFFFKQYLDGVSNALFQLPNVPASSRSQLAYEVQCIALAASSEILPGAVPAVLYYDTERNALLMSEANGDTPLIELLGAGFISSQLSTSLPTWLALLHQKTYGVYTADSLFGNRTFRDFKLGLQYDDIAARLDTDAARRVIACKTEYMGQARCVTHGDINSRNILLNDRCLSIIDFEQSHLGTPVYDRAYILCEIYISLVAAGQETRFLEFLESFLDTYLATFDRESKMQIDEELTCHFAVQVIYRFWGPSRRSWTYYVDDGAAERVVKLARRMLLAEKPLTRVV